MKHINKNKAIINEYKNNYNFAVSKDASDGKEISKKAKDLILAQDRLIKYLEKELKNV